MLYQEVQKIFTSLGSSLANLSANLDTTITIAVTTYVAARWLSPRISDFCEQHPDTTVRFVHNVNTELFDITDVDIAIRWGKCGEPEPHRVHEIPMPLFACAKPALIRNHCASREMTDLGNLTLLCEDRTEDLWREWTDPQTSIEGCARRTIEDANVRVQAAVDGMGLILADDMMQFELQAGLLERFGDRNLPGYGYTLLRNPLTAKRPLVNELVFDIIR